MYIPVSKRIHGRELNAPLPQRCPNSPQVKWFGEIVHVRPVSFMALTAMAVSMALLIVCFILRIQSVLATHS